MTTQDKPGSPPWCKAGSAAARFRAGFAAQVGLDAALFASPGTTVVAREDRAGSNAAVGYWVESHLVLWVDPAVEHRVAHLASPDTIDAGALSAGLADAGFELFASADMRLLSGPPPAAAPLPDRYRHHTLSVGRPADMDQIRRFAERSDPDDVEEAAMEHVLDGSADFDEHAIHVVVDSTNDDTLVAYASACPWEWDQAFGDIGVLVDTEHRDAGLGRFVVVNTVSQLIREGAQPLYRHDRKNDRSRRVATALGFEPATTLAYHVLGGGNPGLT